MPSRVSRFDKHTTDSPQLNRRSPSGSLSSQDSLVSSDSVSESRGRFDKVDTNTPCGIPCHWSFCHAMGKSPFKQKLQEFRKCS